MSFEYRPTKFQVTELDKHGNPIAGTEIEATQVDFQMVRSEAEKLVDSLAAAVRLAFQPAIITLTGLASRLHDAFFGISRIERIRRSAIEDHGITEVDIRKVFADGEVVLCNGRRINVDPDNPPQKLTWR